MHKSLLDTRPEQAVTGSGPVCEETAEAFARSGFSQKLDDHFMIAGEMIDGKGEDSYYSALAMDSAVAAVFDGCGGIGSRRYSNFGRHTGAYMASRAACSALRRWFSGTGKTAEGLREEMRRSMEICMEYRGETSRIMGSMVSDFPTTAAIVHVREPEEEPGRDPGDVLQVTCFWAGDSRVYLMDEKGLAQLTEDDLRGQNIDAMSNLRTDAPLSNYICAGKDFVLHARTLDVRGPFAVFAATDGCFGYLQTPFHFEELVLSCLQEAGSPELFETLLSDRIRQFAGDDYTLAFMNFGYGDFSSFQHAFEGRLDQVREAYVRPIESAGNKVSPQILEKLWSSYRADYERFLPVR